MVKATINDTDDIRCTLSFTMSLREWKAIKETLENKHSGWESMQIINDIRDLVLQLERTLYPSQSED